MRTREDGTYEDLQTHLLKPFKKGVCYKIEIDLAYDDYNVWELEPVELFIYASIVSCSKDQLLLESSPISNTNWKRYVFDFIPNDDYEFLLFEPTCISNESYYGAILMDNIKLHEGWNDYNFIKMDTVVDLVSNITLHPSESESYDWNPKVGLNCYDCKNPVATVTDSITYTLTISDDQECGEFTEIFKIGYYCETDSFYLPIEMLDTMVSPDEAVTLEPSISERYLWFPKKGLNCNDCPRPRARTNKTVDYFATLLKSEGCYTVEKFTLNSVCDTIYTHAFEMLDTTIARYSTLFLHASSSPEYIWSPTNNLDCYDCSKPLLVATTSQKYYVSLQDEIGCIYQQYFNINVVDCDTIEYYTTLDTTIKSNTHITLFPTGGQKFYWTPIPGLSCYDCKNPEVRIDENSNFTVSITDQYGCEWQEIFNIEINDSDSSRIFVPNIITPNNDGFNDVLEIDPLFDNTSLRIFTSQGRLVFSQDNYDNTWNGIDNSGSPLDEGTYWYVVEAPGFDRVFSGYIYIKLE